MIKEFKIDLRGCTVDEMQSIALKVQESFPNFTIIGSSVYLMRDHNGIGTGINPYHFLESKLPEISVSEFVDSVKTSLTIELIESPGVTPYMQFMAAFNQLCTSIPLEPIDRCTVKNLINHRLGT